MVKLLIIFFLVFSFYPTIFLISQKDNLTDKNREFILEHNYYWPDYNLYLSKIRQGFEGSLTAVEKYTSEPYHRGSLIQEFYVILGLLGRFLGLDPNNSYLLGRIILAPLLLLIIYKFSKFYFPPSNSPAPPLTVRGGWGALWQLLAFLIVIVSGSFPRLWFDQAGSIQIGRYMEWWSNIDALQRITFIPHILFGQIVSFYILYQLTTYNLPASPAGGQLTTKKLILLIFLGNLVGLAFPPSLITLNGVLILTLFIRIKFSKFIGLLGYWVIGLFVILTFPSLLYFLYMTKIPPWSALVEFHRTHPMMIPLDQYVLGTGPIMFLGFAGALLSIIKRDKRFRPLILWVTVTLGMASFFSVVRDQSPLRFTQTGLFIPLGILGAYFFQQIYTLLLNAGGARSGSPKIGVPLWVDFGAVERQAPLIKIIYFSIIALYLTGSLSMMKVSLDWQITWIKQLVNATIPAVPSPPQAMFPLRDWMDAIRWLRDNTDHNEVVLAEVTAGNYIPAYSGNFVYFGQANTVDYERKLVEVDSFFKGQISQRQAEIFLTSGRIKYVFFSIQEKEKSGGKELNLLYPFLKPVYKNPQVVIYSI